MRRAKRTLDARLPPGYAYVVKTNFHERFYYRFAPRRVGPDARWQATK
jgi:hypothetical protein